MKVVILLVAFLMAGCSGPLITVRPLPTNDQEFVDMCYDKYTSFPNLPIHTDVVIKSCERVVQAYNDRRIKEGKVPYQNDPNLVYWYMW